jgi:dephospho-CoA kinase
MLRVGLTGGIASGKSTVGGMLREFDCPVLDADTLGHELLERGQEAREEVVREFGDEILDAHGNVDRSKLGQIIFADASKRARLNQILHPRILDVVRKWFTAQGHPGGPELAVVEAALIIEAGYNKELDKVIVCWCPAEHQLQRLVDRGLTLEEAKQRIAAQMPMEEKRRLGDETIDCSGSIKDTERQVMEVVKRLSRPAAPAGGNIS